MAARPETTWKRLNNAFQNYLSFIGRKENKCQLSLLDLLHVSNFKGGNASITSTEDEIAERLESYSDLLRQIADKFDDRALAELDDQETETLISFCAKFLELTLSESTCIKGFGPSYASALIAAHFPTLVPVLDRRIINGLRIKADWDSQGQIKQIEKHYPDVIRTFRKRLQAKSGGSVRDLDRELFAVPLPPLKPKSPGKQTPKSKS